MSFFARYLEPASLMLARLKTVDGPGSGLDADLLDGHDSAYFMSSGTAAGGDLSGTYPNPTVAKVAGVTPSAFILTLLDDASSSVARGTLGSTTVGDALFIAASAAAARSTLGLVIGTNVQAWDADLDAIAALSSAADKLPYSTGAQAWALASFTAAGRSLVAGASASAQRTTLGSTTVGDALFIAATAAAARTTLGSTTVGDALFITATAAAARTTLGSTTVGDAVFIAASASAARTALGLVIGTDVQAWDAELAALAGLTSAADKLPYFTGSGTAATADFTAAGRALVDDASAAAQRTTLGSTTVGDAVFIAATAAAARSALGSTTVGDAVFIAASASAARTALALGTISTQDASSVTLTGGTINGTAIGGSTPAAGAFTTLSSSGLATLNSASVSTTLGVTGTSSLTGNVGIGKASSAFVLDILTAGNNGLKLDNGSRQLYFGATGGDATIGTLSNHLFYFITNGSNRVTIAATGEVAVTTSTASTSSTTGALTVAGGVGIAGNLTTAGGFGKGVVSTATAAGTTTLTTASATAQIFTGTTTQTCQLPAANALGAGIGIRYTIKNRSTGDVTIARAGSDTIDGETSLVLVGGDNACAELISDGVSAWEIL